MYKILISSPCIHNNISNKNSTAMQSVNKLNTLV